MTSNSDMPAVPQSGIEDSEGRFSDSSDWGGSGLTKREQFCLTMGVADTGDEELDAIICKGNEQKFAGLAMQGILANSVMGDSNLHDSADEWKKDISGSSIEFAKALLAELDKERDDEQ